MHESLISGGGTIEMAEASLSMADVDIQTAATAHKTFSKRSFWNNLSYTLAGAAAVTAILAILWSGSTLIYVSMSFSLLLSSSVTVQRFKLSRQETLREVMNQVRNQVNRLQRENNTLTLELDKLECQAAQLRETENRLATITKQQNTNASTFIYEVKQNKIVQDEIQQLLINDVMQNMLSALLRADSDQDFRIDPEEVDILIMRVKSLPGVEGVDEGRIKQILLKKGSGLDAILQVVTDLTSEKPDGTKALVQVSAKGLVVPP